jgi:hypothetical protein
MMPSKSLFRLAPALALCALLSGCLNLKPAADTTRHFVLAALPPAQSPPPAATASLAVGVGPVKLPTYLFTRSMAVRHGSHEIQYLDLALWAERLDQGFQRTLAANLSTLLPSDRVRLPAWRREDVALEAHVALERFEVEAQGTGVLVAYWRITSPGGDNVLRHGVSRFSRPGPSPAANPGGAAATLSELAADLSRELASALREAAPRG